MEKITAKFIELCRSYAENKSDVLTHAAENHKKVCLYSIEFNLIKLVFKYVKKSSTYEQPNSLCCLVYLHKNSKLHYHLVDILPYLDRKNFKCCYFSSIENAERMECCFSALTEITDGILPEIGKLALNDQDVRHGLFDHYKRWYKLKEQDLDFRKIDDTSSIDSKFFLNLQKNRDRLMFMRFSTDICYSGLINGNREKAVKHYKKQQEKNQLLKYEEELLAFLSSPESKNYTFISDECNSQYSANEFNKPVHLIKSFLICLLPSCLIFCSLFAIHNHIVAEDAVAVLCAPWYAGFLPAVICALCGMFFLSQYIPRKNISAQKLKDLNQALNPKGMRMFFAVLMAVSVLVASFFTVLVMSSETRFYEDKLSFVKDEFSFKYTYFSYDDVHSVYFISARTNGYNEIIEAPSYVILFKDKTTLDLYGFTDIEESEEKIVPLLKEKGFEIQQAYSENDLPWYTW